MLKLQQQNVLIQHTECKKNETNGEAMATRGTNLAYRMQKNESIAEAMATRCTNPTYRVINVDDDDSTAEDENQPKCTICNGTITSSRDEGYADTQNPCTCKHNYHTICNDTITFTRDKGYADTQNRCTCKYNCHHNCLLQMQEHCLNRKTSMKCHKCKQQIINILDSEKGNTFETEEDTDLCPICQERLATHFELG